MRFSSRLVQCKFCVVMCCTPTKNVSEKKEKTLRATEIAQTLRKEKHIKYPWAPEERGNHKRSRTHHKVPWPASLPVNLSDYLPGVACPCFSGHNVAKLLSG